MAPDAQFNPEPNAILRALVTLAYGVQWRLAFLLLAGHRMLMVGKLRNGGLS